MAIVYSLHASDNTHLSKTQDSTYPNVYKFHSQEHEVKTAKAFHTVIQNTAKAGDCLIKGLLLRNLNDESRARSTDSSTQTDWLVFDLDGAPYDKPADFVSELPREFHNVSYVVQYSASQGLKPGLRCHLFFLLETPVFPATLKIWLKYLNFSIPKLRGALQLTATNVALLWPLDVTVCQNDKIIYVAPPQYRTDKKKPRSWIQHVKKKSDHVTFNNIKFDANQVKLDEKHIINELRKAAGYSPKRTFNTRKIGNIEVMPSPGECAVTGHKTERDFHYLNLNGGDSWGYYHPVGQNEILYNFKGEPNYLIKELLPEYYRFLNNTESTAGKNRSRTPQTNDGSTDATYASIRYLAFCDPRTDGYYRGWYDEGEEFLQLDKTNSLTKIKHFLKQHGQPIPDFIPEWNLIYDFQSDIIIDDYARTINLFQKTEYLAEVQPSSRCPTLIRQLLQHLVNYDKNVFDHLVNWLAFIIQKRRQTRTAWIFSGTQGTGKGILFNKILSVIIGDAYSFRTQLSAFDQEFNGFMEHSLLVLIDEAQITDLKNASPAVAKIKQYITDERVPIRKMRTDPYVVGNVANFIINTNNYNAMRIDIGDRRFNVAPRQEVPLLKVMNETQIDEMCTPDNLQAFTNYLASYKVSVKKATTIIQTAEHERLAQLTRDSAEELSHAIKEGNLAFFIDNAPDREDRASLELNCHLEHTRKYQEIIDEWVMHSKTQAQFHIPRVDLEVVCYYILGVQYTTRHKFSKYIGHKGITFTTIRTPDGLTRGISNARFYPDKEAIKQWNTKTKKTTVKKVVNIQRARKKP